MSKFRETLSKFKARTKPATEGKFGAQIATFENGVKGVLKVRSFANDDFRGIPKTEMHKREVAVYRLDRDLLRFNVVPETLLIRWKGKEASMQHFVEGNMAREIVPGLFDKKLSDWKFRVAKLFSTINLDDLTKIVVLDLLTNNVDRHAKNVVIDRVAKRVYAIDNALSFGRFFSSYRSVFHKYLFFSHLEVPDSILRTLKGLTVDVLTPVLGPFLGAEEIEQTALRAQFIVDHADRLAFKRMSGGNISRDQFPSYEKWFWRKMAASAPADSVEPALVFAPAPIATDVDAKAN